MKRKMANRPKKSPPNPDDKHHRWEFHEHEEIFLAGPDSFVKEILRLTRITWEYLRGFYRFHDVHNCVTIFGSARFHQQHPYYEMAYQVGKLLAKEGFTVMTGGGPGIMEAANRGAKEAGGKSIGCNIRLPEEQMPNNYLDKWITFKFFFIRKVMLTKYSLSFIVMPGGYGTLDELFEMATLIQTGKIKNFPIVLMGKSFWQPLINYLQETLVAQGTIVDTDVHKLIITDSPQEAVSYIKEFKRNSHKTLKDDTSQLV